MKSASQTGNIDSRGTPIVETCGESFPDGSMIDVVSSPPRTQPHLLLWNGQKTLIAPQVEYGGRVYRAQELRASI